MIGMGIQSLANDPSLASSNSIGDLGYYGVFTSSHEGTNTTSYSYHAGMLRPRSQVENTFEFALGRYEDLLRKLAD